MALPANASSLKLISVCLFSVAAKDFNTWTHLSSLGETNFVVWQDTYENC